MINDAEQITTIVPINNINYISKGYIKKPVKMGSGTSHFLLSLLLMFPLLSRAENNKNEVERQLRTHILTLVDNWQKMNKIERIQPELTLRSSRAVATLSRCSSEIRFTKKSDKLLGVQQWKASCSSPNRTIVMRSQLSIKALLPVTKETLQRGQVIQPDMLTMQWVNYPSSRAQIVTRMSQLQGKRVSHKLGRLKAIQAKQLISNIWVMAGEHVIIEANASGFSANMKGEALQSGGEGQAIKVKNLSSGKVILAYPIGKGKVETRF